VRFTYQMTRCDIQVFSASDGHKIIFEFGRTQHA